MLRLPYRRTTLTLLTILMISIITIPVYADSNIFKKGDKSPEIVEVQAALKKLGFFNEDCTGYFGDVTEAAVIKFQKKYDLGSDGVIGSTTISWINDKAGEHITIPSRSLTSRKDTTKVNVRYTVKKNDTIWDIAADYNVSVDSVLEYNNLDAGSILDIGDEIIIPNVLKVVKPSPPSTAAKPEDKATVESQTPPVQDSSELRNIYEHNENIYVVKEGDTVESIAEDFGVAAESIWKENNFNIDSDIKIGQEVKIPKGSEVEIDEASKADPDTSNNKGEYLDWFKEVQYLYEKGDIATVTDVETGKSFNVKRLYGRNHADSEPLAAEDTKIMKSIYGSWSWNRRAIIVTLKDNAGVERKIAASMNGMPHGGESIANNNFKGHFCIHFKNSRTHSGSRLDPGHQKAVKIAAGL